MTIGEHESLRTSILLQGEVEAQHNSVVSGDAEVKINLYKNKIIPLLFILLSSVVDCHSIERFQFKLLLLSVYRREYINIKLYEHDLNCFNNFFRI